MQAFARRWCYWLAVVLSLHGCSGIGTRQQSPGSGQLYQEHASHLESIQEWGLVGRLALDDGEQGGSGKLRWDVHSSGSDLDFHGAMGRGAWQLLVRADHVTLRTADGGVQSAPDVDSLVHAHLGWYLPVADLEWWVRGLLAPGASEAVEYDSNGLLLSLQQSGWSVEFKRYRSAGATVLPVRLEAQRGSYRVKLAVGDWRLGPEPEG